MAKYPTFVKALVPEGSVRDGIYWWQVRRRIRSVAFHLKTQFDPDEPDFKAKVPRGFKPYFEKQDYFDGWANFGTTWDVGGREFSEEAESPLVVVPRWLSVWEENEIENDVQMRENEIAARKRRRGIESNLQSDD